VVLTGHLRDALRKLNPDLPEKAVDDAAAKLTQFDFSRSTIQHNDKGCSGGEERALRLHAWLNKPAQ
jgi:hypothetical protein